ncbi:hypothetical protein BH10PLA1_BH10PLA1_10990 [soil metagenome]
MLLSAVQLDQRILQAFAGTPPPPGGRRRILISAYTMSPSRGSEPAGAWNVVTRLAAHHDVTVLTCPAPEGTDYRDETFAYLRKNRISGLNVHYVAAPPLARALMKPTGTLARLFYYIGYASWQRAVLKVARELHAQHPYDLVHQLNMTGYREPGYLWKLDAPFVWGPIGGACNMPWSFLSMMGAKDKLFYGLRNIANIFQRYTNVRCRRAAHAAQKIWTIGSDEKNLVENIWKRDIAESMLDSGTDPKPRESTNYDGTRPLRLVWSGVHIGRKALPILLRALAPLKDTHKIEVTVLGAGPQTEAWDTVASEAGVTGMIRWKGKLSRDAAMAEMTKADALVFTSLSEGAPYVVLEALSMGLPVLCHDACGMAVAVDHTSGIKVPLIDPATSIRGFSAAIARLADDPIELRRLSNGAVRRATELTWDAKVEQICRVYDRIFAAPSALHPPAPPVPPTSEGSVASSSPINP